MEFFFQGLTLGLAYVAPIGMQNMFVINSALAQSRSRGLLTALIVIFFDVTLALACFFGIGAVMTRFPVLRMVVLLCGGVLVVMIGVGLLRAKGETPGEAAVPCSLGKTISTACVVTWFNPQAVIDGTMMLGAFRVTLAASAGVIFMIGVALASFLWFCSLTLAVSLSRRRLRGKALGVINVLCGVVIVFYGLKLLFDFVRLVI